MKVTPERNAEELSQPNVREQQRNARKGSEIGSQEKTGNNKGKIKNAKTSLLAAAMESTELTSAQRQKAVSKPSKMVESPKRIGMI